MDISTLTAFLVLEQKEAQDKHDELKARFKEEDYEEQVEDTCTRNYEEGYADAIAGVLRALKGAN